MAANTTITAETRRKLEAFAGPGKSADELADKVLSQYLMRQEAARELDDIATWGQKHSKRMGHKPSDVQPAIAESRAERHGR
jgi:hypothetical protein